MDRVDKAHAYNPLNVQQFGVPMRTLRKEGPTRGEGRLFYDYSISSPRHRGMPSPRVTPRPPGTRDPMRMPGPIPVFVHTGYNTPRHHSYVEPRLTPRSSPRQVIAAAAREVDQYSPRGGGEMPRLTSRKVRTHRDGNPIGGTELRRYTDERDFRVAYNTLQDPQRMQFAKSVAPVWPPVDPHTAIQLHYTEIGRH